MQSIVQPFALLSRHRIVFLAFLFIHETAAFGHYSPTPDWVGSQFSLITKLWNVIIYRFKLLNFQLPWIGLRIFWVSKYNINSISLNGTLIIQFQVCRLVEGSSPKGGPIWAPNFCSLLLEFIFWILKCRIMIKKDETMRNIICHVILWIRLNFFKEKTQICIM